MRTYLAVSSSHFELYHIYDPNKTIIISEEIIQIKERLRSRPLDVFILNFYSDSLLANASCVAQTKIAYTPKIQTNVTDAVFV